MKRPHRLGRRFALAGAVFALLLCALHGLYLFMASYTVEDALFRRRLEDEARHLASGGLSPRLPSVRHYRNAAALPPELARILVADPAREEFAGQGDRHYHALRLPQGGWLVSEVSSELVVRTQRGPMLRFLLYSSLTILLLTLLPGGWWISHQLRPLDRLAAQVKRLRPEALPARLDEGYPNNEIGVLAQGLAQSLQRIRGFIERETRFTRDVSHELRTPLTVIRHAAELLQRQPLDANGRAQLQRLQESAAQAELTVATLLALAREERLPPQPVDLAALAETVVLRHAHLLSNKPVEVEVSLLPGWTVSAPAGALDILLGNLIYNAFLYTAAGQVVIDRVDDALRVRDSGPGIPPEVLARLGEEGAKGPDSPGLGIGLALVQRLCERFGWTLKVHSNGHGSLIEVRFAMAS
ncbi:sensor histidine kinase [Chitinimonas lacunae]|uniref:histidine kinase n=1 Tax=Chitinimonas lacunae TaxID=1963018 RepID=A0ABV8MPY3_9NEIS